MNKTLIRSIDAVLNDWVKIDDDHRGPLYDKAVECLMLWKKDLEQRENKEKMK